MENNISKVANNSTCRQNNSRFQDLRAGRQVGDKRRMWQNTFSSKVSGWFSSEYAQLTRDENGGKMPNRICVPYGNHDHNTV